MSVPINRVRAWLTAEALAQTERWPLWTPVAFGAADAIYFTVRLLGQAG